MEIKFKTFDDLEFKEKFDSSITRSFLQTRSFRPATWQALMFFPNGYGVSVLFGGQCYSNGEDSYELAILVGNEDDWGITYDTPIADDVLGFLTKEEVTEIMKKVQQLNKL